MLNVNCQLSNVYREQLLDHYHSPRRFKKLEDATHMAELQNLSCGDEMKVYAKVEDNELRDYSFEAEGCAICIASASMLGDLVVNQKPERIANMEYRDIENMLGVNLSPSRIKCAHLSLLALQKALGKS